MSSLPPFATQEGIFGLDAQAYRQSERRRGPRFDSTIPLRTVIGTRFHGRRGANGRRPLTPTRERQPSVSSSGANWVCGARPEEQLFEFQPESTPVGTFHMRPSRGLEVIDSLNIKMRSYRGGCNIVSSCRSGECNRVNLGVASVANRGLLANDAATPRSWDWHDADPRGMCR